MYRGIIQHRGFITEYLRDQILSRPLEQPIGRGRIYRVVHDTTKRDVIPSLTMAPAARLVDRCRIRTAGGATPPSVCWSSATIDGGGAAADFRAGAREAADTAARVVDAGRHGRARRDVRHRALGDASRDVRVAGVRLAERWLRAGDARMQAAT